MHKKTVDDWLTHFGSEQGGGVHLGLERIKTVAHAMGLLPVSVPSIIVAGTNGKGSTVALLEALYLASGYRVGATLSPHIQTFNERIRINGGMVEDVHLLKAFEAIEAARGETFISYFEANILAALYCFKANFVDIVILEVGLGGRLDAANIVDAHLSIITSIALDHQSYLGDTLEAIAEEKAGVMRKGQATVIGSESQALHLKQLAEQKGARPLVYDEVFKQSHTQDSWCFEYGSETVLYPVPLIHPRNAACALMAIHQLEAIVPVKSDVIAQVLVKAQAPGRCMHQYYRCDWLVDVAHNPHAVAYLIQKLTQMPPPKGRRIALFSCMKDKPYMQMIQMLWPWVDEFWTGPLKNERSISLPELHLAFKDQRVRFFDTFNEALTEMLSEVTIDDQVVAFGSFEVVAPVMRRLELLSASQDLGVLSSLC